MGSMRRKRATSNDVVSLGRPDESAARRIGMMGFGGVGLVLLSMVPLMLLAPAPATSGEVMVGLSCLCGGFGALLTGMGLILWAQRPAEAFVDLDQGAVVTEDESISIGDITGVEVRLQRRHQGQFQFARWYAQAWVDGRDEPVVIARTRDLTGIYQSLRVLASEFDLGLHIDGATGVGGEGTSAADALSTVQAERSEAPVWWVYWHGMTLFFGLCVVVIPILLLRPEEGLEQVTAGGVIVAAVVGGIFGVGLYHYAREWALPFAQGIHRVRRRGDEVTYRRNLSSTSWDADDIDYVVRREDFWYGIIVLGDGVARHLPCNKGSVDRVHDAVLAIHADGEPAPTGE